METDDIFKIGFLLLVALIAGIISIDAASMSEWLKTVNLPLTVAGLQMPIGMLVLLLVLFGILIVRSR